MRARIAIVCAGCAVLLGFAAAGCGGDRGADGVDTDAQLEDVDGDVVDAEDAAGTHDVVDTLGGPDTATAEDTATAQDTATVEDAATAEDTAVDIATPDDTAVLEDTATAPEDSVPAPEDTVSPPEDTVSTPADTTPTDTATADTTPAGTPLPGGRPSYVVGMFGGYTTTSRWSILRTLAFSTDGAVAAVSWVWHQDTFTGNAATHKVATGYTTAGGDYTGVVRTPKGFQPGAAGTPLHGTFAYDADGNLLITWSSGKTETWRFSTPTPHPYRMITCIGSSYGVRRAYGFGSQAPLTGVGATMAQIRAAGNLTVQNSWINAYDTADHQNLTYFAMSAYTVVNPNAMKTTESSTPNVCDRWHTYVAGHPASDGRKNYWNHQLGVVGCAEADTPCPTNACTQTTIGVGGGHTLAMLQVLDDDGVFRGWVAAEASLHGRFTGGAVVGVSYWLQP
ncbi:MAG: hypothetical protein EP329_08105 [Deltaproteobacteria bacterium]|nr:MAG: hypothetical protein EP329_08105 [Deltaproteobacteria bacterium]